LPDVYEGSSTIVTAFFSIVTKFSFLVLFVKLYFFVFFKISFIFNHIFLFLALISIIFGSLMSLYQSKIKRLLAFSAIAHMGFIFMSLSLFSLAGLQAFLVYILIYSVLSLNIFSILLTFRSNPFFSKIRNLVEFAGLLKSNFTLAIIFAFNLLSFAGVPPLAGFFGKFLVFQSLIDSSQYFLALCVVILSVISAVYYIRLIRFCFFNDFVKIPTIFTITILPSHSFILILTFFFNLFFFFFQGPLLIFFTNLSLDLFYFSLCSSVIV